MATQTKEQEFNLMKVPQDLIERGKGIAGRGHDVWLAGLGAFAAVEEEGMQLFNTLLEKGRTVESTGRKRVEEMREDLGEQQKKVTHGLEERVYDPVMNALRSFGVPTRREIRELSGKVDSLTRQLNVLLTRMGAPEAPDYAVFYVMAGDEGWMVGKEGTAEPLDIEATKELALERARTLAHQKAPSRLHVYRRDGSIQDTFTYDE